MGGVSRGHQGPEVFRGYSFTITCSTQPQYPGGSFLLTFTGSNRTQTQPAVNHSAAFLFPAADDSHQGNYSCVYENYVFSHNFSSESDLLSLTITDHLVQPDISLTDSMGGVSRGHQGPEVFRGYSFTITCSTQPQYPGGSFLLTFTGSNRTQTQPAVNHSAAFLFPAADDSHQGNYSCVYENYVFSHNFSSESDLLSLTITDHLVQPDISLTESMGGVSRGHQGPEVFRGYSFTITCSTQPQYPGGSFLLTFTGSNRTQTQPAVNHSAAFLFPAADDSHQGNYSCVYDNYVFSHNFSSESELLSLTITGN
ncbi:leukocyte immunoglobulin-like receptor subfamily B member 3-like [Salvelinus fontinalis]|uniref:leukocyte immunoglobulin-like receptor subfamily B member 3-like n=1 Tax=Salvelinus fontinalis TaxID=8038 RepID=UPI002485B5E8|nr:leukocyte immunoglobulin-like receptor subfamily B member 3-like [Salvelinus fontinalis]